MPPVVVDASVALVWCFPDEDNELAGRALRTAAEQGVVVPAVWPYEMANSLRSGVRRTRLTMGDLPGVLRLFERLDVQTVDLSLRELTQSVMALSLAHNLSAYDASYLHVALSESLPLATLDSRLRAAAEAAGCAVFQ